MRNQYLVSLSFTLKCFVHILTIVVQTDELHVHPWIAPPTQIPTTAPVANPFEILKTHTTIQTLNFCLVPRLIAEFGIDHTDYDHYKTATIMIAHIIMSEDLGCYMQDSCPDTIKVYRFQQLAFTKFMLRQLGTCALRQTRTCP